MFAEKKAKEYRSLLLVVNTKRMAREIFDTINREEFDAFHLSTNMCPRHRSVTLYLIRRKLRRMNGKPLLVVSTQLIEAGVDIDFHSVIRMMAGLDSIVQAAGRCNRNNKLHPSRGKVFVIDNNSTLNSGAIPDSLSPSVEAMKCLLTQFRDAPECFGYDLLHPDTMNAYYRCFYSKVKDVMSYPVKDNGRVVYTLLDLLSSNKTGMEAFNCRHHDFKPDGLRGAYRTAGEAFKVIDAYGGDGVIVPYGSVGRRLVSKLCMTRDPVKLRTLLRKSQQFTVNVPPNLRRLLKDSGALSFVQADLNIVSLKEENYHSHIGININGEMMTCEII